MSGSEMQQLQKILLETFDEDELRQLLKFRLDLDLDTATARGSWSGRTFDLLRYLQRNGRVSELVMAVAQERPKRADAQELAGKYAVRPAVEMQVAGAVHTDVPVRDAGLAKTLREELGFIDAALWSATFGLMQGRVCRVEINGPKIEMGTGFLVGPEALLTARHVFDRQHPATRVQFRFDYRSTAGGGTTVGLYKPEIAAPYSSRAWLRRNGRPGRPPPARFAATSVSCCAT
jgi:hypothetical protein